MRFPATAVLALCALGCDAGLKPEVSSTKCPTGICGVVRFLGAVSDSTDYVRVVVYQTIPDSLDKVIAFAGFSDALPLGPDSAFYSCCITPLAPGAYAWILVVWKKVGVLDASSAPAPLREVGSYYDPADTAHLGTVVVPAAGGTGGVGMVADFGRMRSISDFFPAAP